MLKNTFIIGTTLEVVHRQTDINISNEILNIIEEESIESIKQQMKQTKGVSKEVDTEQVMSQIVNNKEYVKKQKMGKKAIETIDKVNELELKIMLIRESVQIIKQNPRLEVSSVKELVRMNGVTKNGKLRHILIIT